MSWRLRYYGKLGAQKVLGGVPGLYRLQEAVKVATGRLESRIDEAFVLRRFEEKVAQFEAADVAPPGVVLEQGSGWHGADLVLFHLAGAQRVLTYDVRPWLRLDLVRAVAAQAPALVDAVARWTDAVAPVRARATALAAAAARPETDMLAALGADYRVTGSMRRDDVEDGAVDLFYSDSVLQRATPADLSLLLGEARRKLAPGGQTHHVIDCKDFHAIDDARIPELGYLRPTGRTWALVTSRYLNYQNRLRMPQIVGRFRAADFEVRTLAERRTPENLALAHELAALPHWRGVDEGDLAVSRFELVGGAARRSPTRLAPAFDPPAVTPAGPDRARRADAPSAART